MAVLGTAIGVIECIFNWLVLLTGKPGRRGNPKEWFDSLPVNCLMTAPLDPVWPGHLSLGA
jgi:hypothetical protein